jgi:4-hydroxy-tetrahydrodipicolinate reductase
MGTLIAALVEESDEFELTARLGSASEPGEMLDADLVVDVTTPAASPGIVEFAVAHGLGVLVGTSGWSAERIAALRRRMGETPETGVVIVPNFSVGSVLATSFAQVAARFYDSIEIVEAHHDAKIDSPSGTAVRTAELVDQARGTRGPVSAPHADQRARGQQVAGVPIHSLRLNGVVARQDVVFAGAGEVLTLTHETLAPGAYRSGILLGLRAVPGARGVVVGLDELLGLSR